MNNFSVYYSVLISQKQCNIFGTIFVCFHSTQSPFFTCHTKTTTKQPQLFVCNYFINHLKNDSAFIRMYVCWNYALSRVHTSISWESGSPSPLGPCIYFHMCYKTFPLFYSQSIRNRFTSLLVGHLIFSPYNIHKYHSFCSRGDIHERGTLHIIAHSSTSRWFGKS